MLLLKFSGNSDVSDKVKSSDPLYLFKLIFTEELCESIAEITNLYTKFFIAKSKFILKFILKKWKVTSSEIKLFLGFSLYKGII